MGAYLLGNVQAEAVSVSVVQLLREVVRGFLSTHVIYCPANRAEYRKAEGLNHCSNDVRYHSRVQHHILLSVEGRLLFPL